MNSIDPEKIYNVQDISKNGWFYWIKSFSTISRWVKRDIQYWKILNPVTVGTKTGTRYFIKGENIIKFIAMFEDGSLHQTLKPKGGDNKMIDETTQAEETETTKTADEAETETEETGAEETTSETEENNN